MTMVMPPMTTTPMVVTMSPVVKAATPARPLSTSPATARTSLGEVAHASIVARTVCRCPHYFKAPQLTTDAGHNKADCPNPSTAECKACHEQGHTAEECEANRMHLMFADIGIEDMPAEAAWENLEKVDKSRDVDDFKVALFVYAKALPVVTLEELEKAFRGAEFNFHLVAKQQEVSDTMTIVNLQGVPGQEFVVSFQFSVKPRRAKLAEGWPSSQEENVERLASAGFVMDGFVLKCRNCDQIGKCCRAVNITSKEY